MSGMFTSFLTLDESVGWKSCVLSGMILTSGLAYFAYGFTQIAKGVYLLDPPAQFDLGVDTLVLILAGFFVGIGTKLANGCTSGHGVCGLPRLSVRSLAAVLTFMATANIAANLKYYLLPSVDQTVETQYNGDVYAIIGLVLSVGVLLFNIVRNNRGASGLKDIFVSFAVGAIFGLGLLVSGMAKKSKVSGFLTFNSNWDPSLMFVMGGAVLFNLISFNYMMRKMPKPVFAEKWNLPKNNKIDLKLIVGAILFGVGWGIGGICPGPAMLVSPVYAHSMLKFMGGMALGNYSAQFIEKASEQSHQEDSAKLIESGLQKSSKAN